MSTNNTQPAPWAQNTSAQTAPTETVSAEREPATARLPQSQASSDATHDSSSSKEQHETKPVVANTEAADVSEDNIKHRSHATMAWGMLGILSIVLTMLTLFGVVVQFVGWLCVLLIVPLVVVFVLMLLSGRKDESNSSGRGSAIALLVMTVVFAVVLLLLLFSQMAELAFTAVLSLFYLLVENVTLARIIFVIVALVVLILLFKRRADAQAWVERRTKRRWHLITYVVAALAIVVLIWLIMPLILGVLYAVSGIVLSFGLAFVALVSYGIFLTSEKADKLAIAAMIVALVAWFLLVGASAFSA